jgi:hypothetical protein
MKFAAPGGWLLILPGVVICAAESIAEQSTKISKKTISKRRRGGGWDFILQTSGEFLCSQMVCRGTMFQGAILYKEVRNYAGSRAEI